MQTFAADHIKTAGVRQLIGASDRVHPSGRFCVPAICVLLSYTNNSMMVIGGMKMSTDQYKMIRVEKSIGNDRNAILGLRHPPAVKLVFPLLRINDKPSITSQPLEIESPICV
jgi:hypothetical protein